MLKAVLRDSIPDSRPCLPASFAVRLGEPTAGLESRRTGRFPPPGLNGFTLVELIIVMIVISVVSALAGVIFYRGTGSHELKTFTRDVTASLRTARSYAISRKQIYSFVVPEDRAGYALYAGSGHAEEDEDILPVVQRSAPGSLKILVDDRTEEYRVDFYPQGNSSGGSLVISGDKGESFLITISRITGRVSVEKSR